MPKTIIYAKFHVVSTSIHESGLFEHVMYPWDHMHCVQCQPSQEWITCLNNLYSLVKMTESCLKNLNSSVIMIV